MDLTDKIIAISLGIKYARSFRIPDISGEFIDEVLYSSSSPFGKEIFSHVQEPLNREKVLSNPITNEYLRINTDDLIMGLKVKGNFNDRYKWITTSVVPYLENLFTKYKIHNIIRIGIIYHHKLSKNSQFTDVISKITNDSVKDTENIGVTFSKKIETYEGLLKKGVADYVNTIYAFNEYKKNLLADIDFQYYFNPIQEDLRDCNAKKIIEKAREYLTNSYYPWLSAYEKKS